MGMNGFILIDINRKISKIFRKPISRTFTLQDCCAAPRARPALARSLGLSMRHISHVSLPHFGATVRARS